MDIYVASVDVGDRHTQTVATAPSIVVGEDDVIRLAVGENAVVIFEFIGGKSQAFFLYSVLYEEAFKISAVDVFIDVAYLLSCVSIK